LRGMLRRRKKKKQYLKATVEDFSEKYEDLLQRVQLIELGNASSAMVDYVSKEERFVCEDCSIWCRLDLDTK
jgi:hypothetical protein